MADTIRGLSIDIGLGTAKLDAGLKDLRSKMTALNSELKVNMSAFDRGEKSISKYETQLTGLNKKLQLQADVTEKARKSYEKMVQEHGEGSKEADKAARAFNEEASQLNNLQRYVDGVTQEMKEFEKQQRIASSGWTKFGNKMKDVGGKMKTIGSGMQDVGKKMTLGITTPLVGLGAASVKASIDFESAFAGVRKTVDATESEFAGLEKGIREMAMEIPASAEEISAVAEAAGQLGIEKESILGFTRTMIDLGESTNMTADEAATQLARLANITQMPQENFDRLGSTIVALGNSMATTEGEITAMSLRLAAQGKQVGMTEDQILALAGAMSSVGIEAEAGGTAMTTVLKRMQTAVSDNGKELKLWADVAGMSTKDFKKAFEEDAVTALDMVIKGLASGAAEGENMTEMLGELGIKGVREADTMMRLAGAGDTLSNALETANKGWSENTALTDEAAQRYQTMESQLAILKNSLRDMGYDIGEILLPAVSGMVDKIQDGIKWFKGLSDESKKNIVVLAGVAAAIGPILAGLGTLIVVGGNLATIIGGLSTLIAGAGGFGAALTALAAATGPVGVAVLAIAGLTTGAIALGKYLSGDAIEEVDLFGEELKGVSDDTKEALSAFWELGEGVDEALMDMKVTGGVVTAEMRDEIVGNFGQMNEQILAGMNENYEEQKRIILESFEGTRYLTDQERQKILQQMDTHHQIQTEKQKAQEARIQEIMDRAAKENRALTETEQMEINAIKTRMQDEAVTQLSASAAEEAAIRQRLKDTAGDITAKQAADLIQKAAKVRDETIKAAEDEYDERVATYTYMKDELGTLSQEQYETLVQKAKDQRDDTVAEAEGTYEDIYTETVEGNKAIKDQIDKDTGEILTKWQVFYGNLERTSAEFAKSLLLEQISLNGKAKQKWTEFSNNATTIFQTMKRVIEKLFQDMIRGAAELPGKLGQAIGNGATKAAKGVSAMGNAMLSKLESVVNGLIGGVNSVTSKLGIKSNISRISLPRYARGTGGHPGGLAMVGDGTGAWRGRELIQTPSGELALSPDKPTVVNLPKGTHVLSAPETKRLLGDVPKYAKGTGIAGFLGKAAGKAAGLLSDVWDYAKNPAGLIDRLVSSLGLKINGLFGGAMSMATGAFKYISSKAVEYMKGAFKKAGDFSGGKFGPPFRLTSRAGWRINPVTGLRAFHFGDDYGAPAGTPIPSQSSGVVTQSGWHDLRGNYVRVKSGAYELIYQHNTRNFVKRGDSVTKGQTIGTVGSTGRSTGPHLHFEVWKNGQFIPPASMGFATGGIVNKPTFAALAEEGYPEVVIPTAPNRRTDAMKLLAIAGRMIGGKDTSTRPNQIASNAGSDNGAVIELLLEQNQLLKALLQKDSNLYLDSGVLAGSTSQHLGGRQSMVQRMRGR